jgi:two-component sensor histidine kinase
VPLDLDQALVCGLIVNELVTNALKHAFTDGSKGEIMIGLRDRGEETRILEVRDNGPGMKPPGGEKDQTLGLTLVRTLARQLGGQVFFEAGVGTTVRIEFPIKQTLGEIRT